MDSYTIKFACTINSKNLEIIRPLFTAGVIKLDQDIDDSLLSCCKYGNLEYIELYESLYLNDFCTKLSKCIEVATIYGHLHILKFIYEKHPGYILNNDKMFNLACSENKIDILSWFHKIDPDIITKSIIGIYSCCKNGNIEIAQWIHSIDPNHIKKKLSVSPIYRACEYGHLKFAKWLHSIYPEGIKQQCPSGSNGSSGSNQSSYLYYGIYNETVMYVCCKYGYLDIAQWVYKIDPSQLVTHCGKSQHNPIATACYYGHIDIAEWIWSVKPDTLSDFHVKSPFYEACERKDITVAKWIYMHDPKQLIYDSPYNPILIACGVDFVEVFELFVEYNRDYTRTMVCECKDFQSYKKIIDMYHFQTCCPKCRESITKIIKLYEDINVDCAVCLHKVVEPRALTCGHIFCNNCI